MQTQAVGRIAYPLFSNDRGDVLMRGHIKSRIENRSVRWRDGSVLRWSIFHPRRVLPLEWHSRPTVFGSSVLVGPTT